VKHDGKWNLIDTTGKKLVSEGFEEIKGLSGDKNSFAVQKKGKWGIVDIHGKFILPAIYDKAPNDNYFDSGNTLRIKIDGKEGIIDKTGRMLVPPVYDRISYEYGEGDYYIADKDGKYGLLDYNNKVILPFDYDNIQFTFDKSVFIVTKGDYSHALADISGKLITDFGEYHEIWSLNNLFWATKYDSGTIRDGFLNNKGEIALPFKYYIWPMHFDNGYYIVRELPKEEEE